MSTIAQAIRSRTSVNQYDTERGLTDQEIASR